MFYPSCDFHDRTYVGEPNRNPTSIFQSPVIRALVAKNLAEVGMGWQFAVERCGLSGGPYAELMRAEYPTVPSRSGDQRRMLARWYDLHCIIDSFQRTKTKHSFFISALELRGDEAEIDEELFDLRLDYEVYAALSEALAMEPFVLYARAITEHYQELLQPRPMDGDPTWCSKIADWLKEAHKVRLGLATHGQCSAAWIDFLRLTITGERPLQGLGQDSMGRQFATYMDERFRHLILPVWPAGSCTLVSERLRSREWSGQEKAEVDYLHCPPSPPLDLLKTDRAEYLRRTAEIDQIVTAMRRGRDQDHGRQAYQNILAWLAANSDDLVHLVTPCGDPLGAMRR